MEEANLVIPPIVQSLKPHVMDALKYDDATVCGSVMYHCASLQGASDFQVPLGRRGMTEYTGFHLLGSFLCNDPRAHAGFAASSGFVRGVCCTRVSRVATLGFGKGALMMSVERHIRVSRRRLRRAFAGANTIQCNMSRITSPLCRTPSRKTSA